MGRHALPADADDRQSAPAPSPSVPTARTRGRRAATGPAIARSSYVEHREPARVVALHPARKPSPASPTSTAPAAFVSRTGSLRAERALDPRHVRRAANAKRAALILAPALAFTSALTLSMPANAATPAAPGPSVTTASEPLQNYTVAHDVEIPVTSTDSMTATTTTTVVSYPTLVTRFGVTTAQAESAISAALSAGGDRATVLETALQYMGDPYVEGGASHSGIDCSGLTMVAYQAVGIQLVHYVPTQDAAATTISASEALPGDMVVYDNEDHVGLYLGDGLVLQAPHPGEVVDIVPMYSAAHHFARLLPAGS
ncbi:C40 family peptidase [Curtobacterium sp. MCBA15_001]|uniref:C40 family peptidase n=1 Tax=Curtobacterium sp. MCBA15_001 TaxID=1898731 RepID=UPI0008DD70C6|nr:C40 family peptidase [Curtobacterium sp. MCBA15_001]OIH98328.1 hypothetical protein BIU90_00065 [Curtobacterium sp. MCBA15_001]